ncbi:RelA/SpoT family protein [Moheibacter lacus]|uniref:Bifunctional (P)ppGpp synthetase/guanosine-3',5'-bis(Diphosphate) 3'-pyrophosphohydrolase n=1 Tax=Moheibacter lacus TaxID=2745851 RepID=A0A838ZTQ7_9FLAO|nr:bifunctional (p)ppGpp synthetase/guanosine-3',5'-bis(diphosphate) 3'-pyrophosphohydrolase [Moheibacter lacus]MBA5630319.1 bifunctional (p)ppGpp synthetase/guanosine-3',5'-bis(diphosphate) 3'-pyrophosphohydrolase [Moheibacter lacus]
MAEEKVLDPIEKENQEISRRYKLLLKHSYQTLTTDDKKLIRKAFDLAVEAHKDQRRKSGEPYIFHPIEVAKIVADEIGLGATSIAAALLHDVVEDTDYTLDDIREIFGEKIARIIDGLTKISVLNKQDVSIQSENYKKLLLTLSEDVRVILIKIADRLHNMRTLESMQEDKQLKIASETIFIYAPLAHRMGLYNIKSELEDLSLKYTKPDEYASIEQKLIETKEEREKYIHDFTQTVNERLVEEGLEFEIKGRSKSVFSIHRKMLSQHVSFEEVYDKFAIRIIYRSDKKNEKFVAWKIYSVVTDIFRPNPKRLRDWISQPKSTGYESLHITVMGPMARWVEVQIRSERMDELAERGVAAHYKYKENYQVEDSKVDEWISQVREMLENNEGQDASEFIDNFKFNLYAKEIYVFTPKGDLFSLPKGASSLDFAYAIHSNIGDTCLGAKVNGKLYPLSHELQSGDQVEILTSPNQKPKMDWLEFVVTSKARSKIKASLNAARRATSEEGKEILIRKLRHLKLDFSESIVNDLQVFFKLKNSQDVFYKVATGEIDNKSLRKFAEGKSGITGFINRFRPKAKTVSQPEELILQKYDSLVFGPDEEKLDYDLASCCNPIAGDKVFGFVTVAKGIRVHKKDCPNAVALQANQAYRIIRAKWIDSSSQLYRAIINIHGLDRIGLVNDITKIISSNLHVHIRSINISEEDGVFDGKISVSVKNKVQLERILEQLKNIEGIEKVSRTFAN